MVSIRTEVRVGNLDLGELWLQIDGPIKRDLDRRGRAVRRAVVAAAPTGPARKKPWPSDAPGRTKLNQLKSYAVDVDGQRGQWETRIRVKPTARHAQYVIFGTKGSQNRGASGRGNIGSFASGFAIRSPSDKPSRPKLMTLNIPGKGFPKARTVRGQPARDYMSPALRAARD